MIDSIRLQNFRSYKDDSFEFEDGVNIIVGPNASGKTNLLEAILVLALGKSFRAKDADLVQFAKAWSRLDGFFGSQARTVKFIFQGGTLEKSFELSDKPFKRLSLDRTVPIVLFEPNNLQLLIRGPDYRRDYFDDILERTLPGFKALSARYRRVLAQRNALLKQSPAQAKKQLFAWNIRLSELGAQIVEARQNLIAQINKSISKIYGKISGSRTKIELTYDSPLSFNNYSSSLLSRLESSTRLDLARGFTGYGPHREDILISLKNQPAPVSASRGEVRSLLLALKIIELGLLEKARGQKPIFLLDDVFSELDAARRKHLVEHLKNHQAIITTTEADVVVEYFSQNHRLISL